MTAVITEEFALAFPTIIWHKLLGNSAGLNRDLLAAIRAKQSESDGKVRSNVGGWHSETDLFKWKDPSVEIVQKAVHHAIKEIYAFQTQREASTFSMSVHTAGWANVNKPGDYNKLHVHPNANWSGAYYVDPGDAEDPLSGRIEFLDPRNRPGMFESPGTDRNDWFAVSPDAGLLVVFPSWLYHTVTPYHGTRDRVSIAFNTTVSSIEDTEGNPLKLG